MIEFFAPGAPRPQGSMIAIIRRRKTGEPYSQVIHRSDAKLQKWRKVVATVAKHKMQRLHPLGGVVRLSTVFVLPRPKHHWRKDGELSAAGQRAKFPGQKPDLDKLERALGDALTGVAWVDDARIVTGYKAKVYQPRYEASPGVAVRIELADQIDLDIALDRYWEALGVSERQRATQ